MNPPRCCHGGDSPGSNMFKYSVSNKFNFLTARMARNQHIKAGSSILLPGLILAVFLYWPGLHGGVYFDDSHTLSENELVQIDNIDWKTLVKAANSFVAGGREISMLSFALNHYFSGDRILSFKLVNLAIHLSISVFLFLLMVQIVTALSLKGGGADIWSNKAILLLTVFPPLFWLLAPINLGSVLYLSQRMNQLAFLFIVVGLYSHCLIRNRPTISMTNLLLILINLAVVAVLAFMSKENGILFVGYVLILELCIFKPPVFSFLPKRYLPVAITVVVLALAIGVWLVAGGYIERQLSGYNGRTFSLYERVLTQFRVLGFYLSQILVPNNAELSMWHDDFKLSTGWFSPVTTVLSAAWIILLLVLAGYGWKKHALLTFGILWFFIGHSLESTVFPLEMVHEHRNYFGSFGIGLVLAYLIFAARNIGLWVRLSVLSGLLVLNAGVLFARSHIWSNDVVKAVHEATYHPDSSYAQFVLAGYLYRDAIEDVPAAVDRAFVHLEREKDKDQASVANEVLALMLASKTNTPAKDEWVSSAARKIEKIGYSAVNSRAMSELLEHIQDQEATLDYRQVRALFSAAARTKSPQFLTFAAIFHAELTGDFPLALGYFEAAATESRGRPHFVMNLLGAELKLKLFERACETYKSLENNPKLRPFEFDEKIAQAKKWLHENSDCFIVNKGAAILDSN